MVNTTDLRDKILEVIKNSSKPIRAVDIKNNDNIKKERNLINYHLQVLVKNKIVHKSEDKKYSIIREELEAIWDLSDKILDLLKLEEYSPKELEKKLCSDEGTIFRAIGFLETEGLIKEGKKSLEKRGYIPRKGRTTLVISHFREATYTPTYLGYSKIGYCPVCREEIDDEEKVIVASFKHSDSGTTNINPWVSTKIHSKCMSKSKAYEETYHEYESSMICSYCGLPLTPKILPAFKIDYKKIMNHFSGYELDSIHLIEGIKQSWKVPFNHPRIKNKYKIRPDNSTIKGVYEKVKIQIPKWLDDKIEIDKNIPQDARENIYYEIWENFIYVFEQDLSMLSNAEKFLKLLIEYRSEIPEGYNLSNRSKEIWGAACQIKSNYENNIQIHYSRLLGPAASVYSCIDWAFNAEDYDFDKVIPKGLSFEKTLPTIAQTFSIKHGEGYYHPYCADKLRLDHIHRDEN
ncbi:hypothetical protein [uncultured Methanomethylovorans sp.]|uniref:hypothetical protein n=1 Tax=uncultured Methanomethylovorans sp. TaxID=183759 RepID=UPI002AA8A482|nr:hypothetical protein [uncultured Methanomethylovorans sp.]